MRSNPGEVAPAGLDCSPGVTLALGLATNASELAPSGSACMPGLHGAYCRLCINESYYYVDATDEKSTIPASGERPARECK